MKIQVIVFWVATVSCRVMVRTPPFRGTLAAPSSRHKTVSQLVSGQLRSVIRTATFHMNLGNEQRRSTKNSSGKYV
jgi:hypothetical protein